MQAKKTFLVINATLLFTVILYGFEQILGMTLESPSSQGTISEFFLTSVFFLCLTYLTFCPILQLYWNHAIVPLFNLQKLTYLQVLSLVTLYLLIKILLV